MNKETITNELLGPEYQFQELEGSGIGNFCWSSLTFPAFRPLLMNLSENSCMAVGVLCAGLPVGLAVVRILDPEQAELLSLYLIQEHRSRGAGKALLNRIEDFLAPRGIKNLYCNLSSGHPNYEFMDPFIQARGFRNPRRSMVMGKFERDRINEMKWVDRYTLPSDYRVKPWVEQTEEEKNTIIAMACPQGVEAPAGSAAWPFSEPSLLEPLNSFILLRNEEIRGWIVCHRIQNDLIRYTHLHVVQDFRQFGLMIPLFALALQRHREAGPARGIFAIFQTNDDFVNFFRKRLVPHLSSYSESFVYTKKLNDSQEEHNASRG